LKKLDREKDRPGWGIKEERGTGDVFAHARRDVLRYPKTEQKSGIPNVREKCNLY